MVTLGPKSNHERSVHSVTCLGPRLLVNEHSAVASRIVASVTHRGLSLDEDPARSPPPWRRFSANRVVERCLALPSFPDDDVRQSQTAPFRVVRGLACLT